MTKKTKTTSTERWVLILASLASLMVALDVLVVSTALGAIRHHFGASLSELEWTVNAYALSFAVLLIPAASLATASAAGAVRGRPGIVRGRLGGLRTVAQRRAPDRRAGAAGRGRGLVAPLSLSLLGAAFGPQRRAWALGIYSGITGLAVLGGPVVGGAVTQGLAWQWVFWINVPIGWRRSRWC